MNFRSSCLAHSSSSFPVVASYFMALNDENSFSCIIDLWLHFFLSSAGPLCVFLSFESDLCSSLLLLMFALVWPLKRADDGLVQAEWIGWAGTAGGKCLIHVQMRMILLLSPFLFLFFSVRSYNCECEVRDMHS
jgi:hypothetical protein